MIRVLGLNSKVVLADDLVDRRPGPVEWKGNDDAGLVFSRLLGHRRIKTSRGEDGNKGKRDYPGSEVHGKSVPDDSRSRHAIGTAAAALVSMNGDVCDNTIDQERL